MEPSLVTCPTRKMGTPVFLAAAIRRMVDSRTWLTLPGAEATFPLNMVWMESITRTPGFKESIIRRIESMSVSETTSILGIFSKRRPLRIRICLVDSSPETYKTLTPFSDRPSNACSMMVDFPMPGSPPISVMEPRTRPPPKTRSNSPMPVDRRHSSASSMESRRVGLALARPKIFSSDDFAEAASSAKASH